MDMNPDFYGIQTSPFMPYVIWTLFIGMGVVFNTVCNEIITYLIPKIRVGIGNRNSHRD